MSRSKKETRPPECREIAVLLPALPDAEPAAPERGRLECHFAACPACREEAEALLGLRALLRRHPAPGTVLPSGAQVAREIVRLEQARRWPLLPARARSLVWGGALAAAALALALLRPAPHGAPAALAPAAEPLPALVVLDDERTGRRVILAPQLAWSEGGRADRAE